jgi:flagellar biogenesis protein FliO
MTLTFAITPHLANQLLASLIVLAMLVTLAWVVRKCIGE